MQKCTCICIHTLEYEELMTRLYCVSILFSLRPKRPRSVKANWRPVSPDTWAYVSVNFPINERSLIGVLRCWKDRIFPKPRDTTQCKLRPTFEFQGTFNHFFLHQCHSCIITVLFFSHMCPQRHEWSEKCQKCQWLEGWLAKIGGKMGVLMKK